MNAVRLTDFAHGGGCGCKIAPGVLAEMLAGLPVPADFPELLVGTDSADDAAVYRLSDDQALVATTDFFMPIVDDARDFGRIAAANALSDVYAMGGRPILALAVVGMPVGKLPLATVREILAGGASICAEAGIPVAGGHSIDAPEPIYGLVALGLVHPDRIKRNDRARAGDVLILGKPLGIGILSAALKAGNLPASGYRALVELTTRLNRVGAALGGMEGVHAMTDVTGFGLLGHLLEICRGSGLAAEISWGAIPVIALALDLAERGTVTGASGRNWQGYGEGVELPAGFPPWRRALLCDPQTSGGLLVACRPDCAAEVLARFHGSGFAEAAVIGRLAAGRAAVRVAA